MGERCRQEHCPDCVDFKTAIRASQWRDLGAGLTVVLTGRPQELDVFGEMLRRFGAPERFGVMADLPGPSRPPLRYLNAWKRAGTTGFGV